jgi:hypothetical protein
MRLKCADCDTRNERAGEFDPAEETARGCVGVEERAVEEIWIKRRGQRWVKWEVVESEYDDKGEEDTDDKERDNR